MNAVGEPLARYRLGRSLGRGATAEVFEARRLDDGRRVVVKMLLPRHAAQPGRRERFRDAALLQAQLDHPHILPVHEVHADADGCFVVTPFVGGGTLEGVLASKTLPPRRALRLLRQIAGALDAARAAGVPHGNLKPANVLVENDHAYVADFGLGAAVAPGAPQAPGPPDTPAYAAPERLRSLPPTPAADLYSLAVHVVEWLTGTPGPPLGSRLYEVPPPRVSDLRQGLPRELDVVLGKALDWNPDRRPESAVELLDDVAAVLGAADAFDPAPAERKEGSAEGDDTDTLDDPVPELPPVPEIEIEDGARVWPAALTGAAVVAALAGAGFWLGHSGAGSNANRPVGNGAIQVTAPEAWQPVAPTATASLDLERAFELVPRPAQSSTIFTAGLARGVPPGFLSAQELERLDGAPRALVRLAGGVGYRYGPVAEGRSGRKLVLFVLPGVTRSGVVVCSGSPGPRLAECEGVAGTLRLSGRVYDLRPSRAFAGSMNGALRELRAYRRNGLLELAQAGSRREQARWEGLVAVGYRTTGASLLRLVDALQDGATPPLVLAPSRRLLAAVKKAGVAYTHLAATARRGDQPGYVANRARAYAAEAAIRRALADLRALGYARG